MLPISAKVPDRFIPAEYDRSAALRRYEEAVSARGKLPADATDDVRADAEKVMADAEKAVEAVDKALADLGRDPLVYDIQVATSLQKAAFRRDVLATGAEYPGDAQVFEVMRAGVKALVEPEQQAELLAIIESGEDTPAAERGDHLVADLAELERVMRLHWQPYRDLVAARDHYLQVAPIVAAQHFLRGWSGLDLDFKRRMDRVPDALLDRLPAGHVMQVGYRAIALMNVSEALAKNSDSPSGAPSTTAASAAA